MSNPFLKFAVRRIFESTSRKRALGQARDLKTKYLKLADSLPSGAGQTPITVPPMPGINEDMREWSFFMILEHNTIVNRSITAIVSQLAHGHALSGAARIDMKKDVIPSKTADDLQVQAFEESIDHHLIVVNDLPRLRRTKKSPHPVFGKFDAHKWNCMFTFHLKLHLRQAEQVVRSSSAASNSV